MKPDDNSIYSKQFLKKHWDSLVSIGLPLPLIENEQNWGYFIEHFDHPSLPDFSMATLSKESLITLRTLILEYDSSAKNHMFVRQIEYSLWMKGYNLLSSCPLLR